MIRHPGKTAAQRKALDQIGSGEYCPPMTKKTRETLLAANLIVQLDDKIVGRDRFGEIAIPQFEMPTPIHMQWCDYWAENAE